MAKSYPKGLTNVGKTVWDIYRDLYKLSTPSADFDELYENAQYSTEYNGKKVKDIPYMDYYLDDDLYNDIVERHVAKNKYNLSKHEMESVKISAFLGCGPTSCEKYKPQTDE